MAMEFVRGVGKVVARPRILRMAALVLPFVLNGCGGNPPTSIADGGSVDLLQASCPPLPISLNRSNLNAWGFNGGIASFLSEAGDEIIRFSAPQGAKDPGVALVPANGVGWKNPCATKVSFDIKGEMNGARLDVQIYLEGDSSTTPSVPGRDIPVSAEWTTVSIEIPAGSRVVKIQPLAIGALNQPVVVDFRNVQL